jgi:hypothetical protein
VAEARLGAAGLGLAAPQRSVGARGCAQNAGYGGPWIPAAQSYIRSVSLIGQTKMTPHFVQRLFVMKIASPRCLVPGACFFREVRHEVARYEWTRRKEGRPMTSTA